MDQIETPLKMTQRRLKRSLTAPATSPNRQKVMANAKPLSSPNCVSEMPRSALIGPTSSEIMKRSSTDSQYMNASTIVAYHANARGGTDGCAAAQSWADRKSTRLQSSH